MVAASLIDGRLVASRLDVAAGTCDEKFKLKVGEVPDYSISNAV